MRTIRGTAPLNTDKYSLWEVTPLAEMKVRLERLQTMRAVHTHALGDTPEEDAGKKIREWARSNGITGTSGNRLFGRNTYPTDNPEPHGYEIYLTINQEPERRGNISIGEIPGGLYVILRFKNLDRIGEAWKKMWTWITENSYEFIGWKKGRYGWVDGFEEHINWYVEETPLTEWMFDLWVQIKE